MTEQPHLTPTHQATLASSAIDPTVALERSYRSVTPSDPHLHDFADYQRANGILIAVRPPDGTNGRYQLRRDVDRIRPDGSTAKYEQPAGGEHRLDVHPRFHHVLSDPSVPLWIGEGIKKGDALASRGQACVSLGGVDCGRTPACLKDWKHIAIAGRTFLVCFDYDPKPVTRLNVGRARDKLASFLTEQGGRVRVVDMPPGPNGSKQGVDDFLANGGELVTLLAKHCEDWRPPAEGDCARDDCRATRRELAEERKRAVAEAQILTGAGIRPNRRVPYFLLVNRLRSDATRSRHPEAEPGKPKAWTVEQPLADEQGYIGVNLQGMAKESGVSYAVLLKARSELIEHGVFEAREETERIPRPNEPDRSIEITRTLLRPAAASPMEMVRKLATIVQAPSGWGGKREWRCPHHHEAKIELKHVCAACGADAELVEVSSFQVETRTGIASQPSYRTYRDQLENRSDVAPAADAELVEITEFQLENRSAAPPAQHTRVMLAGARPPVAATQQRLQREARAEIDALVERRTATAFQVEKRRPEPDGSPTNPDATQRRCDDCGNLTRNADRAQCAPCRQTRAAAARPPELPLDVPTSPEADVGFDPPADGTRSPWLLQFLSLGADVGWQSHTLGGYRVRKGAKHWEQFAVEHADKLPRVVKELRLLRQASDWMVL